MGEGFRCRDFWRFHLYQRGSYALLELTVEGPKLLYLSIFYRSKRALLEVELWSPWFAGRARSHKLKLAPHLYRWYNPDALKGRDVEASS